MVYESDASDDRSSSSSSTYSSDRSSDSDSEVSESEDDSETDDDEKLADGSEIYSRLCSSNSSWSQVNTYETAENEIEFTKSRPADPSKPQLTKKLPIERKERASTGTVKTTKEEDECINLLSRASILSCINKTCCKRDCLAQVSLQDGAIEGDLTKSYALIEHFRSKMLKTKKGNERKRFIQEQIES